MSSSEIKRVPLDFNHPLDKTWPGYIRPERFKEADCPDCEHGYTSEYEWLEKILFLLLMLPEYTEEQLAEKAERGLNGQLHPWLSNLPLKPKALPGPGIAALTGGLAGREPRKFAICHDASDNWNAARKVVAAAGLDFDKWALCKTCKGSASLEVYPGQRAEAEAWTPTDPPSGEGWQLWRQWENRAPLSPVFSTADDLARWMVVNSSRMEGMTFDAALQFVNGGWKD